MGKTLCPNTSEAEPGHPQIVTTGERHKESMLCIVARITSPRLVSRFLFKSEPIFGKYWIVPPVLTGLAHEPWQRTGEGFEMLGR